MLADSIGVGYSDWYDDMSYDKKIPLSFPAEFKLPCWEERLAENAKQGTLILFGVDIDGYGARKYKADWDAWLMMMDAEVDDDGRVDYDEAWVFENYLNEGEDSSTADAMLQLWLFGGVVFG